MVAVAKKTAAKKTAAASGPKMVGSVDMSKVDREVLVKYALRLKVGTGGDSDETLVAALSAKFKKLGAERLVDCTTCGGDSDRDLDDCPYCGDANEDEDADESDDDDDQDAAASKDDDASDDASEDDDQVAMASASIDDDHEEVAAANARAAAKPASALAGIGIGGRRRKAAAPSTALATTGTVVSIVNAPQHTEADFDEALKRVIRLKGEPMVSLWRLGAEIKAIYDSQLWKQRNKEGGGAAYTSFNQCVIKEMGFTVQNAYWLMNVSAAFNEDQVRLYGTTKLGSILAAPKEDRDALLEMAKDGATVKQLKTAARAAAEKAGTADLEQDTGRRKTPRKKSERAQKAKKAAKQKPTITVASIVGKQSIRLYKAMKPEVRATKLSDTPTGVLILENGVCMHFIVTTSPSGEWVLRVDTKREE